MENEDIQCIVPGPSLGAGTSQLTSSQVSCSNAVSHTLCCGWKL